MLVAVERRNSALRCGEYFSNGDDGGGAKQDAVLAGFGGDERASSRPKRLRSFAGTTIVPRLPTLADSIGDRFQRSIRISDIRAHVNKTVKCLKVESSKVWKKTAGLKYV